MTGEGDCSTLATSGGRRVGMEAGQGGPWCGQMVQSSGFLWNCTNVKGAFSEAN